jgi:hypothetical protein
MPLGPPHAVAVKSGISWFLLAGPGQMATFIVECWRFREKIEQCSRQQRLPTPTMEDKRIDL